MTRPNKAIRIKCYFGALLLMATCLSNTLICETSERHLYTISDTDFPDVTGIDINHRPAGKYGFVKAVGERFEFENGDEVRFWGTNVQAYALLQSDKDTVKLHAKRMAKLGFNLVRFHHFDSSWVRPNIFAQPDRDTLAINPESMEKLDWWIKCLKDEGIYVWLDLHVGRQFTENDGITDFLDASGGKPSSGLRGFNYFNDDIFTAMADFSQSLLQHENRYTRVKYADEPAIMAALITNENDLSHHFGNALIASRSGPKHHEKFIQALDKISAFTNIDKNSAKKTWEMGDSKKFLANVEYAFFNEMIDEVRKTGFRAPLATTNYWGGMSISGLPSLAFGDFVDAHYYTREDELSLNPFKKAGILHWLSSAQVSGKPYTVSEWNAQEFPDPFRSQLPLVMASHAAFQGWDALMLYGYAQVSLHSMADGDNWSSFRDPVVMAVMPAASLLYRQQHVTGAVNTYSLSLAEDVFFGERVSADTSLAIRTISEKSRLTVDVGPFPSIPWLSRPLQKEQEKVAHRERHLVKNYKNAYLLPESRAVKSDTNQIQRNWETGVYAVNSAQSVVLAGNLSNMVNESLGPVTISLKNRTGVIAIQSLDRKPINDSSRLLVTGISDTVLKNGGGQSVGISPLNGSVEISLKGDYQLRELSKDSVAQSVPQTRDGRQKIVFDNNIQSPWMLLERIDPAIHSAYPEQANGQL